MVHRLLVGGSGHRELEDDVLARQLLVHSREGVDLVLEVRLVLAVKEAEANRDERAAKGA